MRIDIISAAPLLLESPFSHSIVKRGIDKLLVEIYVHNLRDFAINKHGQIDDYPYGGQAGMVLRCEPISEIIEKLNSERNYDEVIYLTPDGETLNQKISNQISTLNNIILLCGHYKGIDQRIRELYITKEISIGDYVLSGGEIAAIVLVDSLVRLLPGVLGNEESALSDSFQDELLAPPIYTRPSDFKGLKVPEVLLSGNFKKIEEWKQNQAEKITLNKRPDLK